MEEPPIAVHSALDTARRHVDAACNGIANAELVLGNARTILQYALANTHQQPYGRSNRALQMGMNYPLPSS